MKKLSDYQGEEAIDLWADLMEPAATILADKEVAAVMQEKGKPPIVIVHKILKRHKKEAIEILTRIDSTPVNGLNAVTRLLVLIGELMEDEVARSFFATQGQTMAGESSGSDTENTEASGISVVS